MSEPIDPNDPEEVAFDEALRSLDGMHVSGGSRCRCCGERFTPTPGRTLTCNWCYEECTNEGCVKSQPDVRAISGDLRHLNDEIQEFVSTKGAEVPIDLMKLLADLDWFTKGQLDTTAVSGDITIDTLQAECDEWQVKVAALQAQVTALTMDLEARYQEVERLTAERNTIEVAATRTITDLNAGVDKWKARAKATTERRLRDNTTWIDWIIRLRDERDGAKREVDRLREGLHEMDKWHQPIWVSEEAKAAGKEPWVCETCGVADGHWPCDTKDIIAELLTQEDPMTPSDPPSDEWLTANIHELSGHLDACLDGLGHSDVSSLRWLREFQAAVPSLPVPDPPDDVRPRGKRCRHGDPCAETALFAWDATLGNVCNLCGDPITQSERERRVNTAIDAGAVVVFAEGLNNGDRLRWSAAWSAYVVDRRVLTDKEPTPGSTRATPEEGDHA